MICEECCICLEILDEDLKLLPCKHIIHNKCILKMNNSECKSKNKCPLCREIINKTIKLEEKCVRNNNIPLPIVQLFMFMNPFNNI